MLLCTIDEDIKRQGFCMIHCEDYKARHAMYDQWLKERPNWVHKTLGHSALSSKFVFVCPECEKAAPEHLCRPVHYTYDVGPGEIDFTCPRCEQTFSQAGDDDFHYAHPDKNLIVVTLQWKGKRYYRKQLAQSTCKIHEHTSKSF